MVLVIALAVIFGVMTKGFTDWSMFGGEEQQEQEQTDESGEANKQEDLLVSEGENNGFKLMSAPYMVTDSMTGEARVAGQTVSVEDPMTSFITYTWSLSWSGSGDVNDYVTLSATTGTSVTVTCLQAFGSQITLTCKAMVEDEELANAACTVDYRKRISGFMIDGKTITEGGTISFSDLSDLGFREAMKTNGYVFNFEPVYDVGTVEDTIAGWSVEVNQGGVGKNTYEFQTNSFDLLNALTKPFSNMEDVANVLGQGNYDDSYEAIFYKTFAMADWKFTITGTNQSGSTTVAFNLHLPASMCAEAYTLELDNGNIIF